MFEALGIKFDNWRDRVILRIQDYHPGWFIAIVLLVVLSPMTLGMLLGWPQLGQTIQSIIMFCGSIISLVCVLRDAKARRIEMKNQQLEWDRRRNENIPPYEGF